jgi:hypothetical protein
MIECGPSQIGPMDCFISSFVGNRFFTLPLKTWFLGIGKVLRFRSREHSNGYGDEY